MSIIRKISLVSFILFVCLFAFALTASADMTVYEHQEDIKSNDSFAAVFIKDCLSSYIDQTVLISFDGIGTENHDIFFYAGYETGISVASSFQCPLSNDGYHHYSYYVKVKDWGQQYPANEDPAQGGMIAIVDTEGGEYTLANFRIDLLDNVPNENLFPYGERERISENGVLEYDIGGILAPYVGQNVCISFDLRAIANKDILISAKDASAANIAYLPESALHIPASTEYIRYYFTSNVVDHTNGGEQGSAVLLFTSEGNDFVNFEVRNFKVELGDQVTDWRPGLL